MNHQQFLERRALDLMSQIEDLRNDDIMFHKAYPSIWARYILASDAKRNMAYVIEILNKTIDSLKEEKN